MGYTLYHQADLRMPPGDCPGPTTTALGDWYATRLNIGWHRLLICVSSNDLVPVVTTARSPGRLPARLAAGLDRLLRRHGVDPSLIAPEVEAMTCWVTAPAAFAPVILEAARAYSWTARDMLRTATDPATLDDVSARLVAAGGLAERLPTLLGR